MQCNKKYQKQKLCKQELKVNTNTTILEERGEEGERRLLKSIEDRVGRRRKGGEREGGKKKEEKREREGAEKKEKGERRTHKHWKKTQKGFLDKKIKKEKEAK
jgi:hypothetical protein